MRQNQYGLSTLYARNDKNAKIMTKNVMYI